MLKLLNLNYLIKSKKYFNILKINSNNFSPLNYSNNFFIQSSKFYLTKNKENNSKKISEFNIFYSKSKYFSSPLLLASLSSLSLVSSSPSQLLSSSLSFENYNNSS